ncbi:unnamed protein product [Fraxinus pennsylvanica]|uniref:Uncharacterized protein n=1 Tax=Fraxinus pennsylvanica TaxID=56036 RepID=A0AAD2AHM1_9LAMI|nr:unnamed protein product [Fraxinus pennsylvanica]
MSLSSKCLGGIHQFGIHLCGAEQASPNRLTTHEADDENGSLKPLAMNFIKAKRLWAATKISRRQFHGQEKQQQQEERSKNTSKCHPIPPTSKVVTLEEWILSSPGPNRSYTSGGDLHDSGLKGSLMKFMKPRRSWAAMKIGKKQFHGQEYQQQLLKIPLRVHPSFDGEHEDFEPNSKASFPVETPMEINKSEKGQLENTSLCTNESGKMKKIVSFRNPVVADVFLLVSPQTNS